ncbi:Propanediol utilization protein [Cetobacterium ceti]|uniref:Phosphate propanoyltransferase n=1 Tax=Cetobacterium ceti TaxID=180163 RepID=A0A1T4NLN9_9FUSO|nr:phosphate propanoyltransferase [Cetobacterium ceti]SJZ80122.1 Propanediol utilization protein [Cetobacterium ceti]
MKNMENLEEILNILLRGVNKGIPVGISNRHIHLSRKDMDKLFGEEAELTKLKDLSQVGQFAAKEVVTLCGPKGVIEKVRVLGPFRGETQIELSMGDCIKLGIKGEVRLSGNLENSSGITLVGPKGAIELSRGAIISQRHIHMNEEDGKKYGVSNGDIVSVKIDGVRGGVLNNVSIRIDNLFKLECHLDIEEANCLGLNPKSKLEIIK